MTKTEPKIDPKIAEQLLIGCPGRTAPYGARRFVAAQAILEKRMQELRE